MMTLILAAAVAAQPAPPANPHGQAQQHEAMKGDCCKDCCKHMADKHGGHDAEHGGHSAQ